MKIDNYEKIKKLMTEREALINRVNNLDRMREDGVYITITTLDIAKRGALYFEEDDYPIQDIIQAFRDDMSDKIKKIEQEIKEL